jgi:hypothetical protein
MYRSRLAHMARERQEDLDAGRPARGLFTGRGRSERASHDAPAPKSRRAIADEPPAADFDDDADDELDEEFRELGRGNRRVSMAADARRERASAREDEELGPRTGA